VKSTTLETSAAAGSTDANGMRMSMGFDSFIRNTSLPPWFPLSNLQVGQQKVLGMLNLKKDNSGNVRWDEGAVAKADIPTLLQGAPTPMEPRSRFRVGVVGGGIAGLSCCLEVFVQCEREGLDVEVVLLEGRSRLGGRLWTDRDTFKAGDGVTAFPVDLGASWIHGIDQNPLAALAREAGVDFVTTSEEVKMLKAGMKEVDKAKDESAGILFDKLLDHAVSRSQVSFRFGSAHLILLTPLLYGFRPTIAGPKKMLPPVIPAINLPSDGIHLFSTKLISRRRMTTEQDEDLYRKTPHRIDSLQICQ
jgi:hypothetical protein